MVLEAQPQDAALVDVIRTTLPAPSGLRTVIVFGSVARGDARRDSDIDVAVDTGRRLSAADKRALISAVAEATGRPVDLVDLRAVGEPLLGQILAHGKRIFGSDEHYARLITRHLFDQADFLPYRDRILAERRRAWIGR